MTVLRFIREAFSLLDAAISSACAVRTHRMPDAKALKALGYKTVRVQAREPSNDASQVFTQDNVQHAEELADTLNLPRLQGERFPVESGEIGILLGKDALPGLAALKTAYTPLTPTETK